MSKTAVLSTGRQSQQYNWQVLSQASVYPRLQRLLSEMSRLAIYLSVVMHTFILNSHKLRAASATSDN